MSEPKKNKTQERVKKPDIDLFDVRVRYIPLEEQEENQRLRQLCFLLFQEVIEDLQKESIKT